MGAKGMKSDLKPEVRISQIPFFTEYPCDSLYQLSVIRTYAQSKSLMQ